MAAICPKTQPGDKNQGNSGYGPDKAGPSGGVDHLGVDTSMRLRWTRLGGVRFRWLFNLSLEFLCKPLLTGFGFPLLASS